MTEAEIKQAAEKYFRKVMATGQPVGLIDMFIAGYISAVRKWIPVTERLPDPDTFSGLWSENVWVTDGINVSVGYVYFESKQFNLCEGHELDLRIENITHFMPRFIPSPPNTQP